MAGELRNFDPNKVTAVWTLSPAAGGASIDLTRGLVDAPNAIQEAKDAPPWTRRGDRQANMVRVKSSKKGATLTFTYVAESEIQDQLSAIHLLDELLENQTGVLVIKDLNGTTLLTYVGAFIENDPDVGFGDTASDRVYVFGCAQRIPFLGGATPL